MAGIHHHDWRGGCVAGRRDTGRFVEHISDGQVDWPLPIALEPDADGASLGLIINVGHVVPPRSIGIRESQQDYFIGLGGVETICKAHMMAAACRHRKQLGQS